MKRGTILVEVLLAAGLLVVILVPVLNFFVTGIESNWFASREMRALVLVRENWEAVRSVRERNWPELVDGTYYADWASGNWELVASEEGITTGPFTQKIIVDPGIGFGKTIGHNLTILKNLSELSSLGCPVLVGHSRKAFIGALLDIKDPSSRDDATSVLSALCVQSGVSILRVHDVGKTVHAVKLAEAVING